MRVCEDGRESRKERETERKTERVWETGREGVCVCVCVCVREREREMVRERESARVRARVREKERTRERERKGPSNQQCEHFPCVLRTVCIHYRDYTLPAFRIARLQIRKRLPILCQHALRVQSAISVCLLAQHELIVTMYAVLVVKTRRARERERKIVCVKEK